MWSNAMMATIIPTLALASQYYTGVQRQYGVPCDLGDIGAAYGCGCGPGLIWHGFGCTDFTVCDGVSCGDGNYCTTVYEDACYSCNRDEIAQRGCANYDACVDSCNGTCIFIDWGFVLCYYTSGYTSHGKLCPDTDNCEGGDPCGPNELYRYRVPSDNKCASCSSLQDIFLSASICEDFASCRNTCDGTCFEAIDAVFCHCKPGFSSIGYTCVDGCYDAICDDNADCISNIEGFECTCKPGYIGDGVNNCTDINECQTGNPCKGKLCCNSEGSYQCLEKTNLMPFSPHSFNPGHFPARHLFRPSLRNSNKPSNFPSNKFDELKNKIREEYNCELEPWWNKAGHLSK